MNANQLVPLRETCQALEEAGIRFPDSYFIWESNLHGDWNVFLRNSYKPINPQIPAPTLAELLEWLPQKISSKNILYYLECLPKDSETFLIRYNHWDFSSYTDRVVIRNINPAESAAQLALWVVKNGYKEGSK